MTPMQPSAAGAPGTEDQLGAADNSQEQGSGGFVICIHCDADKKLSVGVETDAEEAQEQPGQEDASDYTPVGSIKEALQMALEIYKNNGEEPSQDAMGKQLQSAGFASGYSED